MRILVTGGTGLIGQRLLPRLCKRHDEVLVLSRQSAPVVPSGCTPVTGDPSLAGPWLDRVDTCQAVVHLAGENVFGRRWSKKFKQRLYDSRVQSTRLVSERLALHPNGPDGSAKILISASAVGIYGSRASEELDEQSEPGDDFLAVICKDWEKATEPAALAGVRVTRLRIGMVLDRNGGALAKMVLPYRWYVGGPMGSGRQWVSWIHGGDLVGLILFALDRPEVAGPLNATAPEPLTNWGFGKVLGKVLRRPSWLKAPAWALRVALGPVSSVVTGGQRVLPQRALQLGYSFLFPDLEQALRDILQKPATGGSARAAGRAAFEDSRAE